MRGAGFARVDRRPFVEWWDGRFDTGPEVFDGLAFFRQGRNIVWVGAEDAAVEGVRPCDGVGVPFVRTARRFWKPTSAAVLRFGAAARRNVVEIDPGQLLDLLARRPIQTSAEVSATLQRGFVIARLAGTPVACVDWREGRGESCVPKGRVLDPVDLPLRYRVEG